MQLSQDRITQRLLFDYYLPSSIRQEEVFAPFPFFIDRGLLEEMRSAACALHGIVLKIINALEAGRRPFEMGDFPFLDGILSLGTPLPPLFWARFDAFRRRGGGIFFSELNFDKPCGQREVAAVERLGPEGNPAQGFSKNFRDGFIECLRTGGVRKARPRVAILVDPAHSEEMHLSYFYIDLLKDTGCDFVIAGSRNFSVSRGRVRVFDAPVDVILRQYPAEHLQEVRDFGRILELHRRGAVLIVNDPRAIVGQAKSLFSHLWDLVGRDDSLLTPSEKEAVRNTVPRTVLLTPENLEEARRDRDRYVIKSVYGRYSEEVYIGCSCTPDEWGEVLAWVAGSGTPHILQEYCPIEKEEALKFTGRGYEAREAFVNYGVYFINGHPSGLNVRFSPDCLTADETVWFSPVAVREKSLRVREYTARDRDALWSEINDEAAFAGGYTGGWTGCLEAFTLDSFEIENRTHEEIASATGRLVPLFVRAVKCVQEHPSLLCPVLGIDRKLEHLVAQSLTESLVFVGRMDWAYDTSGSLKLLEFNAETPAGLMESTALAGLIAERLGRENPNRDLVRRIRDAFDTILRDFSRGQTVKNVGLVSGAYYEDWYNTLAVYEAVRDLPYSFILGEVSGLEARGGRLYLYGTPLDAVYRYYPLDWFSRDEYYEGVIEALGSGTPSINPPSTFICQSKAFFALLWELGSRGFFDGEDLQLIRKYIPFTSLSQESFPRGDYCIKPLFGREGERVRFSIEGGDAPEEEAVFQERIDLQSVPITVRTSYSEERRAAYPIIGVYIAGKDLAGIFTRAGTRITDKWALFIPTFIGTS